MSPTDNYSALRFSTISNVVSNSESYGLYKLSNVKDVEASFKINFDVFDFSAIEIQIKELKSDLDVVDNLYLRTDILSDYVSLYDVLNYTEDSYLFSEIDGHEYDGVPYWITNSPIEQIDTTHSIFFLPDTDTKFFRFKMAE